MPRPGSGLLLQSLVFDCHFFFVLHPQERSWAFREMQSEDAYAEDEGALRAGNRRARGRAQRVASAADGGPREVTSEGDCPEDELQTGNRRARGRAQRVPSATDGGALDATSSVSADDADDSDDGVCVCIIEGAMEHEG